MNQSLNHFFKYSQIFIAGILGYFAELVYDNVITKEKLTFFQIFFAGYNLVLISIAKGLLSYVLTFFNISKNKKLDAYFKILIKAPFFVLLIQIGKRLMQSVDESIFQSICEGLPVTAVYDLVFYFFSDLLSDFHQVFFKIFFTFYLPFSARSLALFVQEIVLGNQYQDLYSKSFRVTVVGLVCSYLSNVQLGRLWKKN
jgi:hypothetical protein